MGASWKLLGAFWRLVEPSWRLLEASWRPLKACWRLLTSSWRPCWAKIAPSRPTKAKTLTNTWKSMFFGLPRGDLGGILEALGGVLEGLRGALEGLGGVLEAKMSQDSAKMRQEPPQERKPRELPSGLRPQGQWRVRARARGRRQGRAWSYPSFGRIFEEERTFTLS